MRAVRSIAPAAALVIAFAATARAQPVPAEERFDVDGDGKPDMVRVTAQAQLEIQLAGKTAGGNPWKAFTGTGKLTRARITWGQGKAFGGHVVIVAEATFGDGDREAMAVRWSKGNLVEVWRGAVGAIGRDREWSVHVEATRYGLLRYRGVPNVERCDREPAYVGAERYDFARGAFRAAAQPVRIAASAPVVTATATVPQAIPHTARAIAFEARAATTSTVRPKEIDDGDPATAWVEDHAGFGKGEFVTFRSSLLGPQNVVAIRIVPGHGASTQAFGDYNRVRRLGLVIGERKLWLDIPVDPAVQKSPAPVYWAMLPEPVATDCATAIIDDVHPRDRSRRNAGDTAIAELAFLTELDLSPGGADAALAQLVAGGGKHARGAARLLAGGGQTAATALIAQAKAVRSDPAALLRVRRALAAIPAGAEELTQGLADPSINAGDAALLTTGLVKLGQLSVSPLTSLLRGSGTSRAAIARAIDALGRIDAPAAQSSLIGAAGRGPRPLRRRIAEALGARAPSELPLLIAAADKPASDPAEADLWRAAGILARRAPHGEDRARAAQTIAARLATATSYELRTRLLTAAGGLDDRAAIDAVRDSVDRSRAGAKVADPHETALRRVAIAALDANRAAEVAPVLEAATRDPDPGVRERAVSALARRQGADAALIERLQRDRWRGVRRAAVAALGARCERPAPRDALLAAAKTATEDPQVRAGALLGLVRCKAPGIGNLLLALVADRKQPETVRRPAVRLLGQLGDRSLTRALIDQFVAFRKRAWSNAESTGLAATAAGALCALGDPAAVPALEDAAVDGNFPDIQAGAIKALGCFCPPGLRDVLGRARGSTQRQVILAIEGTRQKCSP